jgi:hypothetical protein
MLNRAVFVAEIGPTSCETTHCFLAVSEYIAAQTRQVPGPDGRASFLGRGAAFSISDFER